MKKYLISYGDAKYAAQREFLRETALASSFFNGVKIFTPEDIEPHFNVIYDTVKTERGGGYWIWKSYFIKRVLDRLAEGDILMYCDAGCMINAKGKERFDQYIDILNEKGSIDFEVPHLEYQYTKKEVFDYFSATDDIINSNQIMATVILLKKNRYTKFLIDTWYKTVIDNLFLFTDEKKVPQHSGFIDHRHDQSVFSVIRKINGANIMPDETYFLDFVKDGQPYPFWATRLW